MKNILLPALLCLLLPPSLTAFADEWIVRLTIPALGVDHTADTEEQLLRDADGITELDFNAAVKNVTVTYESEYIDLESLQQQLASAGFPASKTVILKEG